MNTPKPAGGRPPIPTFCVRWISFTAQRLMALEVETLTGAEPGARTPDRLNHRNGYRDRDSGDPGRNCRASHPETA